MLKNIWRWSGVLLAGAAMAAEPAALQETAREIPVAAQVDVVVIAVPVLYAPTVQVEHIETPVSEL
jgi:hypothetical protein